MKKNGWIKIAVALAVLLSAVGCSHPTATNEPETDLSAAEQLSVKSQAESSAEDKTSASSQTEKTETSPQESSVLRKVEQSQSERQQESREESKAKPASTGQTENSKAPEPAVSETSRTEPKQPEARPVQEPSVQESAPESSMSDAPAPVKPVVRHKATSLPVDPSLRVPTTDQFSVYLTGEGELTVQITDRGGADGYWAECSEKHGTSSRVIEQKAADGLTVKFNGLTAGQQYSFRIRTSSLTKGTQYYSAQSDEKTITLHDMKVIDGVTYIDGVLIANKTYALPSSYGYGLTGETSAAFYRMVSDATADGISLWIESDFRSYDMQNYTYHYFVNERGMEQADRASARPGHSEHQSGLAIDVNTTWDGFAGTPEAVWLENNCVKYGFIIRYPKGKEHITGYKYEPWHIRYLGTEKAAEIAKSGLTLEEYFGITSAYS